MKHVEERIGSSDPLSTSSDVCYGARRNLVDGSGWITGCKGTGRLPETTAFAIIASPFPKDEWWRFSNFEKNDFNPMPIIVTRFRGGISLQSNLRNFDPEGGRDRLMKLLKFSAISITNGFPLKLEIGILSSIASIARLIVTVSQEIEYNRLKRSHG